VRIDRSDDGDERPDVGDADGLREAKVAAVPDAAGERHDAGRDNDPSVARVERNLEYRATVDAVNRGYAIDQGYARVREIEEKTVTPAMRRIEAEDPDRHLAGLEHRLKGRERVEQKVTHDVQKKGLSAEQAFADVKDAIRYTLRYSEDKYVAGVQADVQRLKDAGTEFVDSRNTWASEQYKGINSWWREQASGQLFEVQFHTQASFDAKQETHGAYERLRTLPEDSGEIRELRTYQREVNAKIPVPPGATDIVIT
jgi:hypothetical protein